MSIWSRIYKQCSEVKDYIYTSENFAYLTDHAYRKLVCCLLNENPKSTRYQKLLSATCSKLIQRQKMTPEELEHKLVINITKLAREYGSCWMNPVRCFSRGGIINALNSRIDDDLSKICGTTGSIPFEALINILSYLVLFRVVHQVEEDKFVREMRFNLFTYYVYIISSSVLIGLLFWFMVVTAALCSSNRLFIGVVCLILCYIICKIIWEKIYKRKEVYNDK